MKLASLVVIALWSGSAAAEPCKAAEKYLRDTIHRIQSVSQDAGEMLVTCMFGGPDDKLVDKLGKETAAMFKDAPVPAEATQCKRDIGNVGDIMQTVGQAVGIHVGLAWVKCSTKAQAFIADQRKHGKTDDQIKPDIEKMVTTWMDGLMKK